MGFSMRRYTISDEQSPPKIAEHDISGFSWAHGNAQVFNWHPLLMVFGFVFCSSQAALVYGSLPFTHLQNKQLHLILHGIGLLSVIIGSTAAFRFHNDHDITNLYSMHSYFGLTLIVLMLLAYVGSFVAFYYPGFAMPLRYAVVPHHVILGIAIFGLVLATAGSGIMEKLMFNNSCDLTGKWISGDVVKGHMAMDCRWGIGLGLILFLNFMFLLLALMMRHVQKSYNNCSNKSFCEAIHSNITDERASLLKD